MALEGARHGVRVNALAPGYILTDVSRVLLESERSETFVKGIPMRRYGEFDDLDGPLLLLASDASSYMTGSTIVVDGGHICSSCDAPKRCLLRYGMLLTKPTRSQGKSQVVDNS